MLLLLLPTLLHLLLWLPALPTLPAMPTTPSTPLQRRAPKCHALARQDQPILSVDCLAALDQLPTTTPLGGIDGHPTDALARFSMSAGVDTNLRLPRHFGWGTCMIGVTVTGANSRDDGDLSSWNRIAQAAHRTIIDCVLIPAHEAKVGGSEVVGTLGKIQVDVFVNQHHTQFLIDLNKPPSAARVPGLSLGSAGPVS